VLQRDTRQLDASPAPLFFISKFPVYTPNEGVWDWLIAGKAGVQLL